jgi:predicted ATPase
MRIAYIDIENFRGIKALKWAPTAGVNCLIGPGDSTKTTILDAIELCLNPRSYIFADDCDFYDLDVKKPVRITVTLADLPTEFIAEDRYGRHLRGWHPTEHKIEDEPADGLDYALSITVTIDESLEARWSIFNDRIGADEKDPPTIRYKDAKLFATTRLGPYAERHLGWGRSSVLTRLGETGSGFNLQLAEASRAARTAFRATEHAVFKKAIDRAEELGKKFSVPARGKYTAELDVQGVNITSGGIALHDANLPLRRLGTGSSRLIVSALQHDAGPPHIALIDEVEHGLEPHRLARLLKSLKTPKEGSGQTQPQIFITTHSPVTIRELTAQDIFAVRSVAGTTQVRSVSATAKDIETAQRHLRGTPEAFLARKIIVGEGRTEQGLARGLDVWWISQSKESFAFLGAVPIDGGGKDKAPQIAEHLLDLGYAVLFLLDSDEEPSAEALKRIREKGGTITQWPDKCSTEERIFLDLPWDAVRELAVFACSCVGDDSVLAVLNNTLVAAGLGKVADLSLPPALDNEPFRRALGKAAKSKNGYWFKGIGRGEELAAIIGPRLTAMATKPLALKLGELRVWTDA